MGNSDKSSQTSVPNRIKRRDVLAGIVSTAGVCAAGPIAAQSANPMADVIVIGAGLSGLNAARLAEQEGLRVVVLESRERLGGRLYTLDDIPGAPEGGGNIIGPVYARFIDLARQLNLTLEPAKLREPSEFRNAAEMAMLHLGGDGILLEDWEGHRRNPFAEPFRGTMPWSFRSAALAPMNPLKDVVDWLDPKFAAHDVSIAEALTKAGHNRRSVSLGVAENQGYGNYPDDVSALHIHQLATWGKTQSGGTGIYHVAGGNQRLPEAMAGTLRNEVRTGEAVVGLREESDHVAVHTASGNIYKAKTALVTLPFSAARALKFDPLLTGRQAEAVSTLAYSTTTQVLFEIEKPYWEQDGLPPSMWTDRPFGQLCAYPHGDDGEMMSGSFWMMGSDALLADRYSDEALTAKCMQELKELRPAAAAALRPIRVLSWQRDPNTAGTWASWGPGQITRFANEMSKPHGRIHFAGEHTAKVERGMEAALESGERAAVELLQRLA